jgi:hypothetical protein
VARCSQWRCGFERYRSGWGRPSAKHSADTDILEALTTFYRERGNETEARRHMKQLRVVAAGL